MGDVHRFKIYTNKWHTKSVRAKGKRTNLGLLHSKHWKHWRRPIIRNVTNEFHKNSLFPFSDLFTFSAIFKNFRLKFIAIPMIEMKQNEIKAAQFMFRQFMSMKVFRKIKHFSQWSFSFHHEHWFNRLSSQMTKMVTFTAAIVSSYCMCLERKHYITASDTCRTYTFKFIWTFEHFARTHSLIAEYMEWMWWYCLWPHSLTLLYTLVRKKNVLVESVCAQRQSHV